MLISAPINRIYMQKYSHNIIIITAVRLPYMYDMSEKLSTYIENAYEKIIQPNALKNAPGITFLIVVCFIFDILNINIKNIDSTRNETKYLSITVNIDISSSTGISDAAI